MNQYAEARGTDFLPGAVKWLLVGLLCIPGVTWLSTAGDPVDYWQYEVPPGQFTYLLSKLAGLYAVVVFWLQLLYGLLGSRGRELLHVELGNRFHRRLGVIVALLVVAHFALFVAGATIRTEHFASQYLVPSFSHGYYRVITTVGLFGAVLLLAGVCVGLTRRRIGSFWRFGHWIVIPAFILGVIHSLLIGSESRISPMTVLYGLMGVTVAAAAAIRFGLVRPSIGRDSS